MAWQAVKRVNEANMMGAGGVVVGRSAAELATWTSPRGNGTKYTRLEFAPIHV